jgi:outer membrane protein assembly factor BamB
MDNDDTGKDSTKKPKRKRLKKFLLVLLCILIGISAFWAVFSFIGRVSSDSLIPQTAILRVSISNPARLVNGILTHESLDEIAAVPALAPAISQLKKLGESDLLKNPLLNFAAQGNMELALLPDGTLIGVWDMGLVSPLLRILPLLSGFVTVPDLYYVQAGKNSRFEYRAGDTTFFIGPYRNTLFISDSSPVFESRSAGGNADKQDKDVAYQTIKPSAYDAALLLSPEFIERLLSVQDEGIAEVMRNIHFSSPAEVGISIFPQKIEMRLTAPVSSGLSALERLLSQRSSVPVMAERLPAGVQYATILSAGTLEELYQAALVFSGPSLDDTLKQADRSSRALLGLSLNDLLYSWSGNEFAVFGMEGRPHPVYAIQITDERKRQAVFDKAFKSIVLNENIRLNLDGTRIPRIEIPAFLQALLRRWDLNLPSPYYIINRDYLLASESAEALLAALRAMQRNDVLPRTADWKNIAGGRSASSAFSLYYSLDLSVPVFLSANTALSGFLGAYRQGLLRMSFEKGRLDLSLALVPGLGGGVTLVKGYPLDMGSGVSNRIYVAGKAPNSRMFFTRGTFAVSMNLTDNSSNELSGQGQSWVIPANVSGPVQVWLVRDRGRVPLVNGDVEAAHGCPLLTGHRLSSPPAARDDRLYLCSEDGKVHVVDTQGSQDIWETSFTSPLRSPPSFLSIQTRREARTYAAVYPKSFFGEIWLLDQDGKALPNWPALLEDDESEDGETGGSFGIGFGSPLLFAHNNRVHVAFITQAGGLSLFDEDASFVAPFPLVLEGIFYQQPVFDGDFLWLVSDNGNLFRVSLDGEVLCQQIPGFSVKEEGYLAVFDGDGDKVPEIFITGEGNALYAYSRNFRSLEGFPLPVWGRPAFVSGGGKPEIIGMGMDNRLYRWQFK